MRNVLTLVALQCLCIAIVKFGDIGFDHPGAYGLDFDHFVMIAIVYCALLLTGIAYAARERYWGWLAVQLIIPIAFYVYESRPRPRPRRPDYESGEYQYLIDVARTQVSKEIGRPSVAISGLEGSLDDNKVFMNLRGMSILYTVEGTVESVVQNNRQ